MIRPKLLRTLFGVRPRGVLHVGAHQAEEMDGYRKQGFGPVIWVEAQEAKIPILERRAAGSEDIVLRAVAWSESGVKLKLNLANNGQSSSLFELEEHKIHHPDIHYVGSTDVETVRLDEAISNKFFFDFVNLDIQGAELQALQGLSERFQQVRWVYCEVNRAELYSNIPLVDAIDSHLSAQGFRRVVTLWTRANWGDALYVREPDTTQWFRMRTAGTVLELMGCARRFLGETLRALGILR